MKIDFLVEDRSTEQFLNIFLSRFLSKEIEFNIYTFNGKPDMLKKLPSRLKAYSNWLPEDMIIFIIIDKDNEDCFQLKEKLEEIVCASGLYSKSKPLNKKWNVVTRIIIEELESWYIGDWEAVCKAYPKLNPDIIKKSKFRDPENIKGGVWEALEKIFQKHGYFKTGIRKIELAKLVAPNVDPNRNVSRSFILFYKTLLDLSVIQH